MTTKQMLRRNERIAKMYWTKNMSVRKIASKIGLSKTRVHEITQEYGYLVD